MVRPSILIASTPLHEHVKSMAAVAKSLVDLDHSVTFVCSLQHQKIIVKSGAVFEPFVGYCDFTDHNLQSRFPRRALLSGQELARFDTEHLFIRSIPSQHQSIQRALKQLTHLNPGCPVLLICDQNFFGAIPGMLGAPGIRPSGHITLSFKALNVSSMDTAPFGSCLLPDGSLSTRWRNIALNLKSQRALQPLQETFQSLLSNLGSSRSEYTFQDTSVYLSDRYLQMCIPDFEYTRSDLPSNIRFAGFPQGGTEVGTAGILEDTLRDTGDRTVIGVSQRSSSSDLTDLTIPTMLAFKDLGDKYLVVASQDAGSAPSNITVPSNVRIVAADAFEAILPDVDLLISSGDYPTVQRALNHGIPMIVAPSTGDEQEHAVRVAWTGVGMNLKSARPSGGSIREAVDKVLKDGTFRGRAVELQMKTKQVNSIDVLSQSIEEVSLGRAFP